MPRAAPAPVRDHIPLEQGLRHGESDFLAVVPFGQRPYSIRTRIKTNNKTSYKILIHVRDHIPLEQGLRRSRIHL